MGLATHLFLLLLSAFSILQSPTLAATRSYIVYLGAHPQGSVSSTLDVTKKAASYYDLLATCMKSKEKAKEAIFYTYTSSINGFAAVLEEEEAEEISRHPQVVSVFPNEEYELHTTRSWEFLGLETGGEVPADSLWVKARFGEDVIIGNIDTGVWPESQSFNDEGMGPIPSKWKGYCDTNDGVKCNRKLIGARYFNKGYKAVIGQPLNASYNTARDTDGHGTHTLSTAGGRFVSGANLLNSANGTAKGGSPNSRVASYKVCWAGCVDADVIAAFDAAIEDGVDILSISLGSRPRPYFSHGIAIGSFHAVRKGILVVCSAGNSGPSINGSVSNVAPWILTVAASTIDRGFPSDVTLGNAQKFKGRSFKSNSLPAGKYYPLVNAMDVKTDNASDRDAQYCIPESLEPTKVEGKILYCLRDFDSGVRKSLVVSEAGGVGMILANRIGSLTNNPQPHFIPTSQVSATDGLSILSYINSTTSSRAFISGRTKVGNIVAPVMAYFSSTGPNAITAEILKPDITAPGVEILAAFSEASGPSSISGDKRRVPFNILSGTSMSCPHVAGIAGLLKTIHPDWSPAAIKSAIMTTAQTTNNVGKDIEDVTRVAANPFNYGSGHIRPGLAVDPGLVYDLTITDYFGFLCAIGYNTTQLSSFDETYKCQQNTTNLLDLNYPSISVPNLSGKVTLTRTLKNVGTPGEYTVTVDAPDGISVTVDPSTLEFTKINEEKKFVVTIDAKEGSKIGMYLSGGILWSDGVHQVRSPVAVKQISK
uniref:Uncharacterized protein MANES_16G104900 n=1 Tax=Rhizophora mucronata TaxID=61149 RepID=A0A2P2IVK6_RHIMU